MEFNTGGLPPEFEEKSIEEDLERRIVIIELEQGREPEPLVTERAPEYLPQDGYLQKEQERERQEELGKMIPRRIP